MPARCLSHSLTAAPDKKKTIIRCSCITLYNCARCTGAQSLLFATKSVVVVMILVANIKQIVFAI